MTRTKLIQFDFNRIPEELRRLPQWVCFKRTQTGAKSAKVPYRPGSHRKAKTTDSATWGSFDQAVGDYRTNGHLDGDPRRDGIGFVFTRHDPYCGVDLDGTVDGLTLTGFAQSIITALDSYTERSVSGRGLHIILRGAVAKGYKGKLIEIYSAERYFIFTGRVWRERCRINENQAEITKLIGQFTEERRKRFPARMPAGIARAALAGTEPVTAHDLDRALAAIRQNPAADRLFRQKDPHPYKSASERDMALCGHLVRILGPEPGLINQVFRLSAAMRSKWDERRGASTWGAGTIRKAIANRA